MKYSFFVFFIFIVLSTLKIDLYSQDTTKSLAFKNNRQPSDYPLFYTPDLAYSLQKQFELMKMANSGDPLAQHELGLRFLQGVNSIKDTVKAAEWIGKAAAQDLPAAYYNYAILLFNGWGVNWDPFQSFLFFRKAAEDGIPQAQYITGIFYTDNFVVKRNINTAWQWILKAHKKGFEPAAEILQEIKEKYNLSEDSVIVNKPSGRNSYYNSPLLYIDFERDIDSTRGVTPEEIISALELTGYDELVEKSRMSKENNTIITLESANLEFLKKAAEFGAPEAFTLIGYYNEIGIRFKKDLINAALNYYQGAKLDSRFAAYLLWKLTLLPEFIQEVERKAKAEDPEALYLFYGLHSLNLTNLIGEERAWEFLEKAALSGIQPACIEKLLNTYTTEVYKEKKITVAAEMKKMMDEGNILAGQRYLSIQILDSSFANPSDFEKLVQYASKGSVIAETLIGYCYAKGIYVNKNPATASRYLRKAAQRGSVFAYHELEALYDSIRPLDDIFSIR